MRSFDRLRLLLDVGRRQSQARRGLECGIEVLPAELRAVAELIVLGARSIASALIPNPHEARVPFAIQKVRMGKVKALYVDNSDQDAFPILVLCRPGEAAQVRRGRFGP